MARCRFLLGFPVASYSLMLGKEHTEFAEGKAQRKVSES